MTHLDSSSYFLTSLSLRACYFTLKNIRFSNTNTPFCEDHPNNNIINNSNSTLLVYMMISTYLIDIFFLSSDIHKAVSLTFPKRRNHGIEGVRDGARVRDDASRRPKNAQLSRNAVQPGIRITHCFYSL